MTGFSIIPEDVDAEQAAAWLSAKKVQPHEWEGDSIFLPSGEQTNLEELREWGNQLLKQDRPTWAWGSEEIPFEFEARPMLEDAFGDLDGFSHEAIVDLQTKLNTWTNKHAVGLLMDVPDQNVVVMLPASWWDQS